MTSGRLAWAMSLAALCTALSLSLYLLAQREPGYDFLTYLQAAGRLERGESLYLFTRDSVNVGILREFLYPPPVAAAFIPFTWVPPSVAVAAWFILQCAVAAAVGWWLVRPMRGLWRLWGAAAYVLFFPLLWEVSLGNLTLLTLAFCIAGWKLRDRAPLAGLCFALALGLKLLPVTLLLFLPLAGRVRAVVWAIGIAVAGAALSAVWLADAWRDYLSLLVTLMTGTPLSGPNIVPAMFSEGPARFFLPGVALVAALIAGLAARRRPESQGLAFAVALASAPLLSSSVRYPYLILALPLLLDHTRIARSQALAGLAIVGRAAAWLVMQAQIAPEPGRAFTLPLYGLLALLVIGGAPLMSDRWRFVGVRKSPDPLGSGPSLSSSD
ncbi:MAG TPA: glycosyltransferase family 87 protein [Candidatus Limnocylindrales bacterium]|nr:glycosyltransferase family 87 protein [Candidatus Limnocylindrales bacterium]